MIARTLLRARAAFALAIFALAMAACAGASPKLVAAPRDPELPWQLNLPAGFQIQLYAKGLEEVRSIAFDGQGVPYVTVMNRGTKLGGKVLALPDDNHDGRADRTVLVADRLDRPHGIAFHDGVLYVSDPGTIWRFRDTNGDMVIDERKRMITNMPYQDDHWARPFVFDNAGNLLVAIGSTCNACQEGNKLRATIQEYHLGGAEPIVEPSATFARGLRSVVGLAWRPGTSELWATNNGPDHLGPTLPNDQLFHLEEGKHYGWPYCHSNRTADPQVLADTGIVTPDRTPKGEFCRDKVARPALLLPPHSAPLGLAFYEGSLFPAAMRGSLFIALHGAFDFSNQNGYRVVRVPFTDGKPGPAEDFITGWVPPNAPKWIGRPVDVAVAPDGSLFVSDDFNGFLYRVTYTGSS